MPTLPVSSLVLRTGILTLVFSNGAQAATQQYWNNGGDGVWGTGPADLSWNTSAGAATPNYAWPNTGDDLAHFADASGGTATIFGEVSAAGVRQSGADYTIEGGTLRLVTGSGGEAPFIALQDGTMHVTAGIAGSAGLVKSGAGNLLLSGPNTYTGTTSIEGGTITLGASNVLSGGNLNLSFGSTLAMGANNQTVSAFVSNGGSVTGSGTLNAASYQLNAGSNVSANLGAGALVTTGVVNFSGNKDTGSLEVAYGILVFTGNSETDTVGIAAGATMVDGGTISDAATITNAGTLSMSVEDQVASYVSNGGTLSGPGRLVAATYTLNEGSLVAGRLGDGVLTTTGNVGITGSADAGTVNVVAGTLALGGGNLSDTAALTLASGAGLRMNGSDTVGSLVSNGGIISGPGTLQAGSYQLNDGTLVSGNLGTGTLTSAGQVSITGTAAAATVGVANGTLFLDGNNLSDSAALTLLGVHAAVELSGDDTVGSFVSEGGIVAEGSGTLTASTYELKNGTSVSGNLGGGTLTSSGGVRVSGSVAADLISITGGYLDNSGVLGTASTRIDIASGSALMAYGTQNYAMLTTGSGPLSGGWRGELVNGSAIAPGDIGAVGSLRVEGDFTNAAGGTLFFDIGTSARDFISSTHTMTFGGTLDLAKLGSGEIEAMVPVYLFSAYEYQGNFSSISEDLAGVVFFNPEQGSITRLDIGSGASFLTRATPNQSSTWIALYDDVVDPGTNNASHRPGQSPPWQVSSGIASSDAPELLAALQASITPEGLDTALLNRLSPEVYGGLSEYSLQALRSHHRSARTSPALAAGGAVPGASAPAGGGAKDAKGTELAAPAANAHRWEIFAAANYFNTGTDGSLGQADYDLNGGGIVVGGRYALGQHFRVNAWLAGDDGRVSGALIDADARGLAVGLGGETFIPAGKRQLRVSAGISYGSWEFEGTRGSAIATGAGWSPGLSSFSDADADAFDAFIGIDSVVWSNDRLRIAPSLGLVYSSASSDAFSEFRGGAGAPIALAVNGAGRDSLAAQFGLSAAADLLPILTLDGETGLQFGMTEETERISARFASGSRPMAAILDPLTDDLFYLGTGLTWRAGDGWNVRLGYRAEFRSEAEALNAVNLSTSVSF